MHRRRFLEASACAAVMAPCAGADTGPLDLRIDPGQTIGTIGADFIGLSYETAQLVNPDYFSAANAGLVALVRRLGSSGVLRIGGNTSAYSVWSPHGSKKSDYIAAPDTGRKAPPRRPVTPAAIRNLRGFLDATGWSLIYGLNMGGGTPEAAADEADYVARTMRNKLVAFQLCNEPDLFSRNGVRDARYNYARFAVEWQRTHDAVRARVPKALFAGPDTAFNNDWLVPFAEQFRSQVRFLSQHYYAEGPPTDPSMTIERLLRPNPALREEFDGMIRTRRETGLPFRMAETNSCYGGGKQGVSDTFASALWGGELMYQLAAAGGMGINFHGGGNGWYTPIAGTPKTGFTARPLYYAMLMFAEVGPGTLVRAKFENGASGVAAFALRANDGSLKAIVFNKNAERDFRLLINTGARRVTALRLEAPLLASKRGMTLGGAALKADASWSSNSQQEFRIDTMTPGLPMPRASALVVSFRP
jgi:hypothetical protein